MLEEVAQECRTRGAEAIVVETDVTDSEAVGQLARTAEAAFGGIGVWINDARIGVVGSLEMHRQVIETNLLGAMAEAHAAPPVFLRQGHGVLVNTVPVGTWTLMPLAA